MEAGLKMDMEREDWKNAAAQASNLSELTLTTGETGKSLKTGRQSVELADRSKDAGSRVINRTTLANALHQAGEREEAEKWFIEAEAIQKEDQPAYPLLYSLQGCQYYDLLLSKGEVGEAFRRGEKTLEWVTKVSWLLDIALDNLTIGRAHLTKALEEKTGNFRDAEKTLDLAVEGLRKAGHQEFIIRGLLARAELFREKGEFEGAETDLSEVLDIAEQGGMLLHLADCKLGFVRLYLAKAEGGERRTEYREKAKENLEEARKIVEETGYHRRDGELERVIETLRD